MSSERRPTIAISGKSGCGNSTVSPLVAEQLGLKLLNYTFKDMAREEGLTFAELCARAEQDESYDRRLDTRVQELASQGGYVVGNRLAIWLIRDADLRVYLDAPLEIRAARIAQREGLSVEQAVKDTRERDGRDRARYLRLYDIDLDSRDAAELVLDTAASDQFQIADRIVERFRQKSV